MFKQIFLPLIVVATFITLVGLLGQGKLNYFFNLPSPTPKVSLKTVKIENLEIDVEVAKSADERAKGLSGRDRLDENSGMVFVFSKDSKPIFWMKDTKIALDIIWINYNKIVGIEKNVQPEIGKSDSELEKYVSPSTIDYVLEVNAGFSDKNNIRSGQMISGLEQL
ncbi:MAG: hypothetical protein UR39_C0016G0004 [Candidatus Woesebacteria bacterium GW2011_GWA1_33_30]|uniref:DUF192 domain-containing protein n=1 Tax=Candidatus Woesebacteria bacterium GW2011_GWA2_33_28 TaxID=1618561 RepID=A0A0G0CXL4_9BACT|nr:MAG: hypothetical protein UR39_C0016G0004 [Candidatus Woesebacteria bacterium GW2011_GWA1_33_30]KKP48102.1 MAG: hypothetical protein UR38_C0002G0205 [Candidatus Woesebacteria bacterium GW2011_GWA2_33_28]KKP50188.1 MAG: hypothetical protein UR40_C0002G0205 [Microgenomates group bacterium GW2011_GWC1_33_32]KKP51958.1 MAG: hypothetical protein UR44_C0006G0204 [Candidatus Woesebacteria bacterium GW2011_GWB1_33_38]KKP58255.1 MAG: hypothetical protein UR48_C0006G0004 [Microgenomates group bacteriu